MFRATLFVLFFTSAGWAEDAITFPPHPRLAITASEWKKLQASPDFATKQTAHRKAGEALLSKGVTVPNGWGNWTFYYACPDDASDLRALNLDEHQCPKCKKVYTDERTVASYRTLLHDRVNHAALELAWAYQYTGDVRFAAEIKRILSRYADDYPGYPARKDRWGKTGIFATLGGRRYSQSLDESVGIIKMCKAYDLTRGAGCWTDAERKHVEQDFFRETARTLLYWNQDINNHQTWYNAGLMCIASVLGDADLVRKVLDMRGGFRDQMNRSLGDDGFWYEGTMAYHNYALQALIVIVDAGRKLGLNLHEEPRFRKMIDMPFSYTYPNGQFPAMNDSDQASIRNFHHAFEWAWQTYQDPKYAQALANGNLKRLQEMLGPDAKIEPYLPTKSQVLSDIGLTILRRGAGENAVTVMLDHGPHGGSHGHYDKLNMVLFANGREWLLDPGRLSYSHKEYQTWVKHTAAHNTVTLGGRSQSACTGKLMKFDDRAEYAMCKASGDDAYPGSKLTRTLFLTDKVLVDLFEVQTSSNTQIDWLTHAQSLKVAPVVSSMESMATSPGTRDGYQHLLKGQTWKMAGPSRWRFEAAPKLHLGVHFAGLAEESVFACEGIGYSIAQKVPCLIRRVEGDRARFLAVYDLTGTADWVTGVEDAATRIRVRTRDRMQEFPLP